MDVKDNGYCSTGKDKDLEMNVDPERVLSGKLSESSGYAGSDLYDYKVLFNPLWNLMTITFCLMFY